MADNRDRAVSRRQFLVRGTAAVAGGAVAARAWSPGASGFWTPPGALAQTPVTALYPQGTTLEATVSRPPGSGYQRLIEGPGWPTVPRTDLAPLQSGREDRRHAVAAFVQLTDVHIVDAQSPGRVEFLDRFGEPYTAAFRPQETLTTQVQSSMVQRINDLGRGPVSGRPLDCAVSTGDNIDNQQHNELDWFMAVLNGGRVTPDSGRPGEYEGVQLVEWQDARYWHPDEGAPSGAYDEAGFPHYPGLLGAGVAGFDAPGLDVAWYSTYGNHDGLIQGNLPRSDAADAILTGSRKITDLPPGEVALQFVGDMLGRAEQVRARLDGGEYPYRTVTADERRRTIKTREWVQAHLDHPGRVGPRGHGYDEGHLDAPALYYAFDVAPGVRGISLDTGGYNSGSIGQVQLDWLDAELRRTHSRAFDASGARVTTGGTDQVVILFSHFTIGTMNGSLPDPARPDERRYEGDELVAFLHRWPNIVAWVNGHTHTNTVTPVPDPSGRTAGFWEITTASHVDFPEHARVVEVLDNGDGTISIVCTMLEHAAPAATDPADHSVVGLAAISRELAANDVGVDVMGRLGGPESRNVELALPAPFDLRAAGITGAGVQAAGTTAPAATVSPAASEPGASSNVPVLVGAGVVAGVAVLGGAALATRRRRDRDGGPAAGQPDRPDATG